MYTKDAFTHLLDGQSLALCFASSCCSCHSFTVMSFHLFIAGNAWPYARKCTLLLFPLMAGSVEESRFEGCEQSFSLSLWLLKWQPSKTLAYILVQTLSGFHFNSQRDTRQGPSLLLVHGFPLLKVMHSLSGVRAPVARDLLYE